MPMVLRELLASVKLHVRLNHHLNNLRDFHGFSKYRNLIKISSRRSC